MSSRLFVMVAALVAATVSCSGVEPKPAEPAVDSGPGDTGTTVADTGADTTSPIDCSKAGCAPPPPCGESCNAPCGCCPNTTCGGDASPDASSETSASDTSADADG